MRPRFHFFGSHLALVRIVLSAMLLISSTDIARSADQAERKYNMGPLRISEFKGDGGVLSTGKAYTSTRTMFSYKFRVKRARPNRFTAELKSITIYSVFLPDSSWWNSPPSAELLVHEQGHFDIAEIAARRLQLAFETTDVKKIRGSGPTQKEAEQSLAEKLRHVVDVADKQIAAENIEYDATTGHGNWQRNQQEQHRIHKLTLEKLEKQLNPESRRTKTKTSSP